MSTELALLIGILPPSIIVLAHIIKAGLDEGFDANLVGPSVLNGLVALSGFGIPFAWESNWLFGLLYGLLLYSALGLHFIEGWVNSNIVIPEKVYQTLGSSIAICLVLTVPMSILPFYRGEHIATESSTVDVIRAIEIDSIKSKFSELEAVLTKEGEKIREALATVTKEIDAQNAELNKLQREKEGMMAELEMYKNIVNLTEDQVNAVTNILGRGKYIDYTIGFLLGLLSSAIVAFGNKILLLRPNKKIQSIS